MFTRTDLFYIRDRMVESFHAATARAEREKAFEMIVKINARLLRAQRHWRMA